MFGQQNLTEFLEVSPTSFLFPVALWIAEGLLLTVMLIHICVADVSDGRNHPLFVLGKSYVGNFPLHGALIHAFFRRPCKIDFLFHLWSVLPQISMSLISYVNRGMRGRH